MSSAVWLQIFQIGKALQNNVEIMGLFLAFRQAISIALIIFLQNVLSLENGPPKEVSVSGLRLINYLRRILQPWTAVSSSGPPASVPELQLWQCHPTRLQLQPPGPECPPPSKEWVREPDHNLCASNNIVCVWPALRLRHYSTCIQTEHAAVLHRGSNVLIPLIRCISWWKHSKNPVQYERCA